MSDIRVPELGESIVEATILNWLKQVGETVESGDAVVELETDKVNIEVMAETSGILAKVSKQAGDTVHVGESIGTIAAGLTVPSDTLATNQQKSLAEEPAPAVAMEKGRSEVDGAGQHGAKIDVSQRATPSMRRQAREQGVAVPVSIQPGAPEPTRSVGNPEQLPANAVALTQPRRDEERQRMTRRRRTIAKRLVEAQHTAAMLTTFNEVDMTRVMEVRARRKEQFKMEHGVSLGFMSFFTKATVAALKAFPRLNAEIQGEDMVLKHHYDIGVAVSTEGGLVVPVVKDVERLSFAEIEQEIARLALKARENTLGLDDLQGGTFTITNGGVFGSLFSTPILNAPQVGILGMHGIMDRPIAVDGRVEIRPMMYIALSYDHRIVDGSEAVRFLAMVKRLIQDPESLLLEA